MKADLASASPMAFFSRAMSWWTASWSVSSTGPTQLEKTTCAIDGVLNRRMASSGKSATSSAWNSERPSKPEKRSLT